MHPGRTDAVKSRQYVFDGRPTGAPDASSFRLVETELPPLEEGQVLVENRFIALGPGAWGPGGEGGPGVQSGLGGLLGEPGAVVRASTAGIVLESRTGRFCEGDAVVGALGARSRGIASGGELRKVNVAVAPLERYLGVLGMSGMTAYFGLFETGETKAGDVVLVSAAAGAVGAAAAQIAKIEGCTVIGTADDERRCGYLTDELGLDAAIDHEREDVGARLAELAPDGVDVCLDNVGGRFLDAALAHLAMRARVVLCGPRPRCGEADGGHGLSNYRALLTRRARMEAVFAADDDPRFGRAAERMANWIGEGRLRACEEVVAGLERFPETFARACAGEIEGETVIGVDH